MNWSERIIKHDGFVDNALKVAAIAPIAITVIQTLYFLPKFNERVKQVEAGVKQPKELWDHDPFFLRGHRGYIAFDTLKISALAVAGLRFGIMLKN